MTALRVLAAAAVAAVLAFALSPASARPCEDDNNAACISGAAQAAPMKLDDFMSTWKPVGVSKRVKKAKTERHHRGVRQAAAARKAARAARQTVASADKKTRVAAAAEPLPVTEKIAPETVAPRAAPAPVAETDGVAVSSFTEANELDAAADRVQVVAANEINDIDLAAPAPPAPPASAASTAPAETTGQSVSTEETPADHSWIGKLLLAAAGTIALAGATRLFLIA